MPDIQVKFPPFKPPPSLLPSLPALLSCMSPLAKEQGHPPASVPTLEVSSAPVLLIKKGKGLPSIQPPDVWQPFPGIKA